MKVQISENIDSMLQAALIQLYKSQPNPPKIVLLAPFNEAADTELIRYIGACFSENYAKY